MCPSMTNIPVPKICHIDRGTVRYTFLTITLWGQWADFNFTDEETMTQKEKTSGAPGWLN